MCENVRVSFDDHVLVIEMHRPQKKNALTVEMYSAVADAIARAHTDQAIRCVLLRGQEDCFTAGNDITDFAENPLSDDGPVTRLIENLISTSKPVVAAVAGAAIGIGSTMLLHCDLVYAANNAKFSFPFVNLGVCPEAASSLLLPRIAGEKRAAELLMLGELFDAETALSFGMVSRVCAPEEVIAEALSTAKKLATKPAKALRVTKELIRGDLEQMRARVVVENQSFEELLVSDEAKEAFSAFLERRKPNFTQFMS